MQGWLPEDQLIRWLIDWPGKPFQPTSTGMIKRVLEIANVTKLFDISKIRSISSDGDVAQMVERTVSNGEA